MFGQQSTFSIDVNAGLHIPNTNPETGNHNGSEFQRMLGIALVDELESNDLAGPQIDHHSNHISSCYFTRGHAPE